MEISRVELILNQLSNLGSILQVTDISFSSITPESKAAELLNDLPCPAKLIEQKKDGSLGFQVVGISSKNRLL